MSLRGGPHHGPVRLSEGMVLIDAPPPAPASDYARPPGCGARVPSYLRRRQVGRLAMLERIATHKPEAT